MKITYGVFFYLAMVQSVFANAEPLNFSLLPDHRLQPASLIDVAGSYPNVIIAELSTGKLYVYKRTRDDTFLLLETMHTSIGKKGYGKEREGDNKTPIGVYRITSHLTPKQLDNFYGNAAYPVNYPNVWDKMHERTGYGIWLHAEPIGLTEKTRPLLDSNGCIVLSNNDIDTINKYVDVGYTYIVMTPEIKVVRVEEVARLRAQLHARLQSWQRAWESLSAEPYLAFYSKDFTDLDKNWEQWVNYKKRVNGSKSFIDVAISDVGIYRYPNEQDMVWVEYYQTYNSSNYKSRGWKRQLWKKEPDHVWRIIYEGGG